MNPITGGNAQVESLGYATGGFAGSNPQIRIALGALTLADGSGMRYVNTYVLPGSPNLLYGDKCLVYPNESLVLSNFQTNGSVGKYRIMIWEFAISS